MSTIIASGVSTVAALNLAIEAAHTQIANGGTFEIDLASNSTIALGATALEAINLNVGNVLVIDGDDATINGGGTQRGLFDYAGSLIVSGLTIADTSAIGGAGGPEAGGHPVKINSRPASRLHQFVRHSPEFETSNRAPGKIRRHNPRNNRDAEFHQSLETRRSLRPPRSTIRRF